MGINSKEIVDKIHEYGYYVLHDYFNITNEIVEKAKFLAYTNDKDEYEFGHVYRKDVVSFFQDVQDFLPIFNVVYNKEFAEIADSFTPDNDIRDVFITHDFRESDTLARNGYLHWDRLRSFKFLIYLEDCEHLDNGPFCVVPGSNKMGKKLRDTTAVHSEYESKKNRVKIDYPELYVEPTPIYGKAGTVIIFDTNTFHLGGCVKNNKERLVIRSHWHPSDDWRAHS